MKRLFLVAGLCVAAALVVPIASASANSLTGVCEINGEAIFTPALTPVPTETTYSFKSTSAKCIRAGMTAPETASVPKLEGKGLLSCEAGAGGLGGSTGTGLPGKGELVVGTEPPFKFELSFVAAAGDVALVVKPEGEPLAGAATGDAEFLTNGAGVLAQCVTGIPTLTFTSVTAGTI
jgi:hypothetical protein